ncbi:MAG: NrfD/PsrC family molybdoenzyme membrane anchor subunit [Mariprofundales bacterium]|nr:NrfD/PsrC family molybdoenzyme membrane anchor subunit [Mariprofundales bacterium]
MVLVGVGAEKYQYDNGLGVALMNRPHYWQLYISNFVFWIGMSHSGTLLSAILLLTKADWRKPIYRFAEAMTLFSILTAALFPIIHLGRIWDLYWVMPYPNERTIWPNFRSPLLWDAAAITTYATSSALFLYVGMIPDMAICRDNATGWRKPLYTALSLGWMGRAREWMAFRKTYVIVACFLVPLAVSVHSIVASDFAMSIVPDWHITSFPPYFVAGALYSGCAAIITLFVMLRYLFRFEAYMTEEIMEKIAKLTFAIALVWNFLNLGEYVSIWYSNDMFEKEVLIQKFIGPYAPVVWGMLICAMIAPFAMAFQKVRRSMWGMFWLSIVLQLGMWLERFQIVSPPLASNHEPWTWSVVWPGTIQLTITAASFAWFTMLFLLFCKVFPSISMYEVKEMAFHRRREGLHDEVENIHDIQEEIIKTERGLT